MGKIVSMLTDSMLKGNLQIFHSQEIVEKIVTELHFKKLILLSKLIIVCVSEDHFKRIETNPKKIKIKTIYSNGNDEMPSKF